MDREKLKGLLKELDLEYQKLEDMKESYRQQLILRRDYLARRYDVEPSLVDVKGLTTNDELTMVYSVVEFKIDLGRDAGLESVLNDIRKLERRLANMENDSKKAQARLEILGEVGE